MDSPMLHYVRYLMILAGTLPVHLASRKRLYIFYQYVVQTSLFIFLIFSYTAISKMRESAEMMLRIFSDILLYTTMYIKGRVCMSKNMSKLITDLITYEEEIRKDDCPKTEGIYKKIVNKSKLIQKGYIAMVNSSSAVFILPHYINYVLSWKEPSNSSDGESQRSNLFLWWLPFDNKHHLLSLFLQTYPAILATIYYCYISLILIILPLHIILRLRVLKSKLRSTKDIGTDTEDKLNTVRNKIKMCIKEHIDVIRNCVLLNDTVKYIMLLEFLLSSCQLALALFQIISAVKSTKTIFDSMYVVLTLMQLLILYLYANEIREESLDVANVVYELPWYQYDKSITTSLWLMMMRSQKALTLTLGPFGNMTLEMFVKIIKTVYTYITLMQQAYEAE